MQFINSLSEQTGKNSAEISSYLRLAPNKYKVYTIPKRSYGYRTIAHPAKELKEYQRAFVDKFPLPAYRAAFAYVSGKSIKLNASLHRHNQYLVKMDLEEFFNSINPNLFWDIWHRYFNELPNAEEKRLLERLLFWSPSKKVTGKLVLSIGAPSSPMVSNFCMYFFDERMQELCDSENVVYSRYADDLTFSTNIKDKLFSIPELVKKVLTEEFGYSLVLNKRKTKFSSKAHNRHVTGVTITNEGNLSIGRDRKRYIKHLVHQAALNQLDVDEQRHLSGLLAFVKDVEPRFINTLIKKYGESILKEVRNVI